MNAIHRTMIGYLTVMLILVMVQSPVQAEDDYEFKYRLNLLPWSTHHGDNDATNETHNGIGVSVTLPNNATYGIMHFENSYGDEGFMFSLSAELEEDCTVCFGVGIGFAPAYSESDNSPVLGWGSVRYKYVQLLVVPTEVTAVLFTIPMEDIFGK